MLPFGTESRTYVVQNKALIFETLKMGFLFIQERQEQRAAAAAKLNDDIHIAILSVDQQKYRKLFRLMPSSKLLLLLLSRCRA